MEDKIVPCSGRLLVKEIPISNRQQRTSGLIIQSDKREKYKKGKVIVAGEGLRASDGSLIPHSFKKDDIIIFNEHMADSYTHCDGEKYLIVNVLEVMLILKEDCIKEQESCSIDSKA